MYTCVCGCKKFTAKTFTLVVLQFGTRVIITTRHFKVYTSKYRIFSILKEALIGISQLAKNEHKIVNIIGCYFMPAFYNTDRNHPADDRVENICIVHMQRSVRKSKRTGII